MKYLVDLNYTLVENSPTSKDTNISPFVWQIEQETYREWLVDFLRKKETILITARASRYKDVTLERIKALTGWQPEDAYFGEISATPSEIKEHLLLNYIFPKYGNRGYFGIESNPKTRVMYAYHCIKSLEAEDFKVQCVDNWTYHDNVKFKDDRSALLDRIPLPLSEEDFHRVSGLMSHNFVLFKDLPEAYQKEYDRMIYVVYKDDPFMAGETSYWKKGRGGEPLYD